MPLSANASLDFGYPWWLSYGHLVVLVLAALLLFLAVARKWSKWLMAALGMVVFWSGAATVVTVFVFNANGQPSLPTENFLREGKGRILDMGAGTGRSSVMVLQSRPGATLVALDLFGESFEHHFGHSQSPQQKLLANLKAAGVEHRATIRTADMRQLPFEPGEFDAIVSAYAVDHLSRDEIRQALAEAARVVKPSGDFLLILIANDRWARFAFGPILSHGGTRGAQWWNARLREAGFDVLEEGSRPLTLYFLARRT
jgi:SAM-dependent methyltransferase